MKKCSSCGQEHEGTVCPSCGTESAPSRSRADSVKRFIGRFLFIAALAILFIGVVLGTDWIVAWIQSLFAQ
ncbi:MAG: hypothetical protein HFE85_01110 [Clostridiales bacterium]|nr:hypothetical protein [Clostridiales bacterium]